MRAFVRLAITVSLLVPVAASAHESRILEIDGARYQVTVGSLNEPVAVDDKTGVDLTVSRISATGALVPVTGLETVLKVELRADGEEKELPIEARYNMPGKYQAPFYPTVETTYEYRVFGHLGGRAIDLTYECSEAGHAMHGEGHDMNETLSDGVKLVGMRGSFGCPKGKADLGFPKQSASVDSLRGSVGAFDSAALVFSLVAFVFSLRAIRKTPSA